MSLRLCLDAAGLDIQELTLERELVVRVTGRVRVMGRDMDAIIAGHSDPTLPLTLTLAATLNCNPSHTCATLTVALSIANCHVQAESTESNSDYQVNIPNPNLAPALT